MLGGGSYISYNKKLPGSFINFVSAAKANASLADRGYVAMPLVWDWGVDGEVFTVTNLDFARDCRAIFGYEYSDEKMKGLRDLFKHAETVHFYKLGTGATKASCDLATAKHAGTRGNELRIVVDVNEDKFDVCTYFGTTLLETQTVSTMSELVDNDYVVFNKEAELVETASTPFVNGTNGTVEASAWQEALKALESYSFNVIGVVSAEETIQDLVIEWTKMMRDQMGIKFQTVVYNNEADDKAVINVVSKPKVGGEADLVFWVAGAEAGCKVNASCTNKKYDGDYDIDVNVSQSELEDALAEGKFIFHRVGEDVRVLEDINSKVTVSVEEGEDFKYNQTIRVIDQVAMDIASLFNTRYLGIIPNDSAGRISLWNDIVKHHQELERLRAIEGFDPEHVVVEQGETKKSVIVTDKITVVNAMAQLYMTVVVA